MAIGTILQKVRIFRMLKKVRTYALALKSYDVTTEVPWMQSNKD